MATPHRSTRPARWSGPAFVLLALVSSGAVSLPLSTDPPARIAALYAEHRGAYTAAQLLGLVGVLVFVGFVRHLSTAPVTSGPLVRASGLAVATAALATNVTVLVLCLGTGLSATGVHRAAVAADVADDALFAAFGLFALVLALTGLPRWLRGLAAAAALLCLLRALEPWVPVPGLEAGAALGILVVLLVVGMVAGRTDEPTALTPVDPAPSGAPAGSAGH